MLVGGGELAPASSTNTEYRGIYGISNINLKKRGKKWTFLVSEFKFQIRIYGPAEMFFYFYALKNLDFFCTQCTVLYKENNNTGKLSSSVI
jgi:hypothetical protein